MKRFSIIKLSIIISSVLIMLTVTSCENKNITNLKKQVSAANAECPINMGSGGDLLSIKYHEKENRVIFYTAISDDLGTIVFQNKNKERIHKLLRLTFSDSKSQKMIKDIVNAKASLMIIYKAPSGKTVKFELPYQELKEMGDFLITDSEIERMFIEAKAEVYNSTCPSKALEGIVMTKVALVDDFMVMYYEIDENVFDIDEIKKILSTNKDQFIGPFKDMIADPSMQSELRMLVNQGMGYQYRYYGNKSKKYVDVIITPEELSEYLR